MSRRQSEAMRFYHGGEPGLSIGEYLVPPQDNPAFVPTARGLCAGRRDRVYITTSRLLATGFAAYVADWRGSVYRVEPVGSIEPDDRGNPPGLPDSSWMCSRARVLEVCDVSPDDLYRTARRLGLTS